MVCDAGHPLACSSSSMSVSMLVSACRLESSLSFPVASIFRSSNIRRSICFFRSSEMVGLFSVTGSTMAGWMQQLLGMVVTDCDENNGRVVIFLSQEVSKARPSEQLRRTYHCKHRRDTSRW